jgi:hypothetical protein
MPVTVRTYASSGTDAGRTQQRPYRGQPLPGHPPRSAGALRSRVCAIGQPTVRATDGPQGRSELGQSRPGGGTPSGCSAAPRPPAGAVPKLIMRVRSPSPAPSAPIHVRDAFVVSHGALVAPDEAKVDKVWVATRRQVQRHSVRPLRRKRVRTPVDAHLLDFGRVRHPEEAAPVSIDRVDVALAVRR